MNGTITLVHVLLSIHVDLGGSKIATKFCKKMSDLINLITYSG